MIGSLIWGTLSDIFGRKIALLLSLIGNAFILFIFGFGDSYVYVLIFRFIWGVFDEITGVAKTVLSEVCDDSNQATGFAITGISFGLAA